jgi:predicted dehydrogenase
MGRVHARFLDVVGGCARSPVPVEAAMHALDVAAAREQSERPRRPVAVSPSGGTE